MPSAWRHTEVRKHGGHASCKQSSSAGKQPGQYLRARHRASAVLGMLMTVCLSVDRLAIPDRINSARIRLPVCAPSACVGAPAHVRSPHSCSRGCSFSRREILSHGGLAASLPVGSGQVARAEVRSPTPQLSKTLVFPGEILKSPNDVRSYRAATLSNGLRVLLVSDPETTTSAAALDVHVGFNSDPEELPGLAHFCEHMLFLGNAEYPEENSFKSFISANGGGQNAFTSETDTTYYFDVSPGSLQEALTRFSAFFKSPLFTASATEREVNAIESEDAKNRQSDGFRLNQLSKSFAREGHPQLHFGTGNRETLLVQPEKLGINTRDALLKHFANYYDAGLMTLCVLGRESTDTLQAWVENAFGGLPARSSSDPSVQWRGVNPYPPLGSLLEVVPVADKRSLSISWPIVFDSDAERLEWSRVQPQHYIGHLLGHEGKGSLLSFLKNQGWANAVSAGVANEDDNFALMRVSVGLTQSGISHRDGIIEAVYGVLERLRKGIPLYIFEECRAIAKIRWRFVEKVAAQRTVLNAVEVMHGADKDPTFYVSGRSLLVDPDVDDLSIASSCPSCRGVAAAVDALLSKLTPATALYASVAKEYAERATNKERWYGTSYSLQRLSAQSQARWLRPQPPLGYELPMPNVFLPTDLSLKASAAIQKEEAAMQPPDLLCDDERWQIFFKADRAYGVPKANIKILLWLPSGPDGSSEVVPARIWQAALADRFGELYYDAGLAGLEVSVATAASALSFSFSGYNDRLPLFLQDVLAKIREFDGPTPDEFERALDLLRRELQSFDILQPYAHAGYFARLAIATPEYPIELFREKVNMVTLDAVKRYGGKLRSKAQRFFGQVLIHGNLNRGDAAQIEETLRGIQFAPIPHDQLTRVRLAKLPAGSETYLVRPEPNFQNVNHALTCVYWIGSDVKDAMLADLFHSMLKDPFFAKLRTEQQLGYIVSSGVERGSLVSRLSLVVQSSVRAPNGLLAAVDAFLGGFRSLLEKMPGQQVQRYKDALAEQIMRRDERLSRESGRWWSEITTFQYQWNRRSKETKVVQTLTKDDVLDFFDRFIAVGGPQRRRFVTAIFAAGPTKDEDMSKFRAQAVVAGATVVDDPEAFKAKLERWPLLDSTPVQATTKDRL